MPLWLSLVLVVLFLAMNAFFVIAEFAMVRVRPSQIEMALAEGRPGAKAAKKVTSNVNAYLSACQLGITLASLALGWLGEPAFAALIRPLLEPIGMPEAAISGIAIAIGYILMTTLHVVVGELIPKSYAIFATENWALRTAGPLFWFYRITFPVMWVFNHLTNFVVKLSGHDPTNEHEAYTDEEIKLLIDESTESGLIDPTQNEFVDNILEIDDKDAESIMTPRTDMICLNVEDSLEDNLKHIRNYKYTRYPVCQNNKDRIIGFVHVKDLYLAQISGEAESLQDLPIRPIEAVPEGISISKLLDLMQRLHTKIVVVVDEHGGTSGIVTMNDIMSLIVGTVDDEYHHSTGEDITERSEGNYLIEGSTPIADVIELLGFEPPEADECETAAGLLLALFDRIPAAGDSVAVSSEDGRRHATFTVEAMDNLRIDEIGVELTVDPINEDED